MSGSCGGTFRGRLGLAGALVSLLIATISSRNSRSKVARKSESTSGGNGLLRDPNTELLPNTGIEGNFVPCYDYAEPDVSWVGGGSFEQFYCNASVGYAARAGLDPMDHCTYDFVEEACPFSCCKERYICSECGWIRPTSAPTRSPTQSPTGTESPTGSPSISPTVSPTYSPSVVPSLSPTAFGECEAQIALVFEQTSQVSVEDLDFLTSYAQQLMSTLYLGDENKNLEYTLLSYGEEQIDQLLPKASSSGEVDFAVGESNLDTALSSLVKNAIATEVVLKESGLDDTTRISYEDIKAVFDMYADVLVEKGNGALIIMGSGHLKKKSTGGLKLQTQHAALLSLRNQFPELTVLCVYTETVKNARSRKKPSLFDSKFGFCDVTYHKRNKHESQSASIVALRNMICPPSKKQDDPCYIINKDPNKKIRRKMCKAVSGNHRGQDGTDLDFADVSYRFMKYCDLTSDDQCQLSSEYKNLFNDVSKTLTNGIDLKETGSSIGTPGSEDEISVTHCQSMKEQTYCLKAPQCDWIQIKKKKKIKEEFCVRTNCDTFVVESACMKGDCEWTIDPAPWQANCYSERYQAHQKSQNKKSKKKNRKGRG